MFLTQWKRVILDEGRHDYSLYLKKIFTITAHSIRDPSSLTFRAICSLHSHSRWVVTGTPVQNKITELPSLLAFLGAYPYSDPQQFDRDITQLWKDGSESAAIDRLKKLLDFIMLRRSGGTIVLPPRHDFKMTLDFSKDEKVVYDRKCRETIACLDSDLSSGIPSRGSFVNALQRINALRMICNLGAYTMPSESVLCPSHNGQVIWNAETAQEAFNELLTVGQADCSYCQDHIDSTSDTNNFSATEDVAQPQLTECLILWCGKCITSPGATNSSLSCHHVPTCATAHVSALQSCVLPSDDMAIPQALDSELPTKLKALQDDLKQQHYDTKSIVFSFWTTTFDVVEIALKQIGCQYVRYDGRVTAKKRAAVLKAFRNDPKIKVLLLSISCGAVGLNLTVASRAYLMEPHWNPTVEEQALARIHRMGQTKEVTTIRFIMRDSFEEHVVEVQNKKKDFATLLLSKQQTSEENLAQSRLLQLRSLLG
jgi:SWI/SNF-related matrix-associated actin-dependent regulator of chromatin subfamily A3